MPEQSETCHESCQNCKHWSRTDLSVIAGIDPDEGSCVIVRRPQRQKPRQAFTAFAYDLVTKADFGCRLFEPKEHQ